MSNVIQQPETGTQERVQIVPQASMPRKNHWGNISLAAAAIGYVALRVGASYFPGAEHNHIYGVSEAFFEAGLVGGLADWFAVTALFRRPLNLPLPHTALLKEKKDELAINIGKFVEEMLNPEDMRRQIDSLQLAALIQQELQKAETRALLKNHFKDAMRGACDALNQESLVRQGKDYMRTQVDKLDYASLLSASLQEAQSSGLVDNIVEKALSGTSKTVKQNLPAVQAYVSSQLGGISRLPGVSGAVDNMVRATCDKLEELSVAPLSGPRQQLRATVGQVVATLQTDAHMREVTREMVTNAIDQGGFIDRAAGFYQGAISNMKADLEREDSQLAKKLDDYIDGFLQDLNKPEFRAALDTRLKGILSQAANQNLSAGIATVVRQKLTAMKADELSADIESRVGPDLQFIRLNGALVGGFFGTLIYLLSTALH